MPIIRRHFLSLYFWFARKTLSACDIISILSVIFIPVLRVLIRFKYCECFLAIIRFKQLSNCRNLYLHFRCFRFGIFTIFFTHFLILDISVFLRSVLIHCAMLLLSMLCVCRHFGPRSGHFSLFRVIFCLPLVFPRLLLIHIFSTSVPSVSRILTRMCF